MIGRKNEKIKVLLQGINSGEVDIKHRQAIEKLISPIRKPKKTGLIKSIMNKLKTGKLKR